MQYPGLGDEGIQLIDEEVSLLGPAFLMLGVLGTGGLLYWLTKKDKGDYYYEDSDAVERVKTVINDIEADEPED